MFRLRLATAVLAFCMLGAPLAAHAKGETLLWLVQDADKAAMVTAKQAIESQLVDLEITLRTVIVPVLATQEAGQKQQARSAAATIKSAMAVAWWRDARTEVVVYVPSTDQIRTRTLEAAEGAEQPSPEMASEALALILRATVETARAERQAKADTSRAQTGATNTETKAMGIASALSSARAKGAAPVPASPNAGLGLAETTTPPPDPADAPAPEPPPLQPDPEPAPAPATPPPAPMIMTIGLGHELTFDANESMPQFASLRLEYALTEAIIFGAAYGFGIPETLEVESVELSFERHRGDFSAGYRFLNTERLSLGLRTGVAVQHTAHETRYLSTGASGAGEGFLLQVGFPAEFVIGLYVTDSLKLNIAGGAFFWLQSPTYAVTQGTRSVDVHTPNALRPSVSVALTYAL